MGEIQHFIYIFLNLLNWAFVIGDDCSTTVCFCDDMQILCQDRGLTEMPQLSGLATGRQYLILDNNNITVIPSGRLPYNLTNISLMDNPISTIDISAFDGSAATLESIIFANARFTQIPLAFLNLHTLKQLSIYDTDILIWSSDVMKNIGHTLETLYLENVGLTNWPDWMYYFPHLTELGIVNSSIASIPDDALDKLASSLTTLTLTNSDLTSIPKTVSKLRSLVSLQLLGNKIWDVTWMPNLSKLSSLSLNNNNISSASNVSDALRPFAESLTVAYFDGNRLITIPDLSFLTKVGGFEFAHNRISNFVFGSMPPNISDLDLGYNYMSSIPIMLSNLLLLTDVVLSWNSIEQVRGVDLPSSVIELDLGNNLITEITDTSFRPDSMITSLLLNNNPIFRISSLAFQGLSRLNELNMQSTRLTRLPLGLALLSSLNSFDITNSNGLVCTCMEKSLAPLFLKMRNVFGDCGLISVYGFFSTLSSSCPA